jgi:amino acid adenylation domain-containing protein
VEFRIEYLATDGTAHGQTRTFLLNFIRPFDLAKAPLLRVSLGEISPDRHILLFDMHHIISDGTSMIIFLKEFMTLYSGGKLSPLKLHYKDFAQWQHDQLRTGKLKKEQEYWLKRFPGELPVLNMPTYFPRPALQSFEGDKFQFKLEKPVTAALKSIIKKTGTTLYMALLAVYNILLSRYTGQEDIVIGTTIAGRHHTDLQGIMGLLIETLVQRNYPMGCLEFKTFLEMVKNETLETHENQAYPFREIIRLVGADNEVSRNPVFDAMLIVQNFETAKFQLEGLKFSPYQPAEDELHKTSKVDFTIEASDVEGSGEIHFTLEYCTRLYKRETMERFARHFLNIIDEAAANPAVRLANIEVMDEAERKQLLETFNDTSHKSSVGIPGIVLDRFQDQAAKTPDRIAIIGLGQVVNDMVFLTYRGLNESAAVLANELIAKGVQPETIVAIMMESSVEMAVGIWGILKAGGAYLPIEPGAPSERIDYMLKDSGTKLLAVANDLEGEKVRRWEGKKVLLESIIYDSNHLKGRPRRGLHRSSFIIHHSNLSYLIYTSGTSGHPKGVMIEHRNLANYVVAVANEIGLRSDDTVLQQGSLVFDAFVEEFYPLLAIGGKVAIPGKMLTRDIPALCQFIARHRVSMIASAPQMVNELNKALRDGLPAPLDARELLASMRIVLVGGDVVKTDYIDKFMEQAEVYNTYGPTESTVCATYYKCSGSPGLSGDVPIGKPLARYEIFIEDKYGSPAPIGVGGELCVGGPGVTRGYMNQPELTAEKFIKYRSYRSYKTYINYRTGDLARWLSDGNIEFLGRIDRQVKIRGYRIELAEIETRLTTLENIKEAVVIDETRKSGDKYLAAYVVCPGTFDAGEIKSRLVLQLPDYMIPTYIIKVEQIPWTGIGKVDRKRLPRPQAAADSRQSFIAPASETEKRLAGIWQQILEKERVGIDENFFDLGGTSLDIMKLNTRIKEEFNKHIPVVSLFKYTTIRALTQLMEEETGNKGPISQEKQKELEILESIKRGQAKFKGRIERQAEADRTGFEIAVIGMSGIFPGASNLHEFWENLKNGVESIHFFSDEELLEDGVDKETIENPNYVKAKGIIAGVEYFDASFFGYTPLEVQIMDPQIRMFQQTVWRALEDAGYDPFSYTRRIGLYAGASPNYYWAGLALFSGMGRNVSGFMAAQLADKDFMCTHTSYKLNLKGPSVSLQTACSTSLVAIHYAVQGLLHGECEMALAGGVSIGYPNKRGYVYQPGMIFSSDGHTRSFDARANGSIFGDGVGVVVLKALEDAVNDRDHIYAVIKGSAINNDGLRKVGYTAPSIQGQAEVIRAAQSMAEVEPETITYIEAHGTATPLGDTVEIEALEQAFGTNKKRFCAVGTLKSNMGHLYSAAGAAGFIKTVLALNHRLIPPSLHFQNPNPQIDFQNSPFYVNTTLKEWRNERYPLRAGVSAFGIGGTNAHVVLEEWDKNRGREEREEREERKLRLLLISARTPSALNKMTENLVQYLQENPAVDLADVAYTLQVGRKHFPYRRMMVSADLHPGQDAGLLAQAAQRASIAQAKEENRPIIFMFCGQGSQYAGMGIDLYRTEPVFRQEVDQCFEILKPLAGYDVKEILYPSLENNRSNGSYRTHTIDQTEIAQPVLFVFEYALAKLLMSWGIRPTAMIGYSFGEYVSACLAGVFSPAEALEMIVTRGKLVQQTPVGKMTSVTLPESELKPLLKEGVSIAIVNGL